jgi:hypothetical protein
MLEIRQIAKYNRARYPRHGEYVLPSKSVPHIVRDLAVLTALAALTETCGPPPPPRFLSEYDARWIITQAFSNAGLSFREDTKVLVRLSGGNSTELNLDGYNDSLKVGYEYVSRGDRDEFTAEICRQLESSKYTSAPHVLTVDALLERESPQEHLEGVVKAFLDSLKAHGVI